MTTYVDMTNLPPTPLEPPSLGVNLRVSGRPDQKYVWLDGAAPGAWIAVAEEDGGVLASPSSTTGSTVFSYSSTIDGGAVNTNKTMRGTPIPVGAIISTVTTVPGTALGGAGTVGLTLISDGDMSAAQPAGTVTGAIPTVSVGLSGTALYFGGAGVNPGTGSTVATTVACSPVVNITVGSITGSFDVFITYMVPV